jgi:hypothetical protein
VTAVTSTPLIASYKTRNKNNYIKNTHPPFCEPVQIFDAVPLKKQRGGTAGVAWTEFSNSTLRT